MLVCMGKFNSTPIDTNQRSQLTHGNITGEQDMDIKKYKDRLRSLGQDITDNEEEEEEEEE